MSSPSTTSLQPAEATPGTSVVAQRLAAAEIDASCRWPLLLLFTSGALWLVFGLFLAFIAAIKLHKGDFLADISWLTLGRIRPASVNSFLYGFASQVGLGVMIWMTCRLGGVKLVFQWPLLVAWKLWNAGVTIGVLAILFGASTGFEWLEMPRYAAGILFVAYAMIGICTVATFAARRERELYPSQWYLLAAVFWFPWIYSAANYLLLLEPVRGTFQAAVNAWYVGNFANLWLTPLSLAGIFYFLPRLTSQPLHSRELATFGFWTLLFFGTFAGLSSLIGGPVPRWMTSVSTAANVCLLVPLIANALNWHWTTPCAREACRKEIALKFVLVGAWCYVLYGLLGALYSVAHVSAIVQFTYAGTARNFLLIFGVSGMVLFGCLYYIIPRLAQVNWPSEGWIRGHFLLTLIGLGLVFVGLTIGGVIQGGRLAKPSVPFIDVVRGTVPFVGLSTLGILLLLAGQCLFLANLLKLLRNFCEPYCRTVCAEYCGCVPAKAGGKS